MKKIFLAIACCLVLTSIKAQELSFEETAKYIKDKVNCCELFSKKIDIKENGLITITEKEGSEKKFNLFDLYKKPGYGSLRAEDNQYGFGFNELNNAVIFQLSSKEDFLIIRLSTQEENLRIVKALRRLLIVCIKEKDPFDN